MLNKIRAWVKLLSAPEISSIRAIKIAKELGEPENYLEISDSPLGDFSFVSQAALQYLEHKADPPGWLNIANLIEEYQIKFLSILDDDYPEILKQIPNPPVWLFYRGAFCEADFKNSLAVVGTRRMSNYSHTQCQRITSELINQGITIISGLAYGIDAVAHKTAIACGGRTLAILGTSVEQVYPPAHRQLAKDIIAHGAVISEYLPGSRINMWNFPNRNRIISGLSRAVWVVEGGKKSGALITASCADEQNRPVMVMPSDINRESAAGSNLLLQQGAYPVLRSADILSIMGIDEQAGSERKIRTEGMNELEQKIYRLLISHDEEIGFDKLLVQSKLSIGELSTIVLSLELKGFARKVSGNRIHIIR